MSVGIIRLTPAGEVAEGHAASVDEARTASADDPVATLGSEWVRLDEAVVVWGTSEEAARSAGLPVEAPTATAPC